MAIINEIIKTITPMIIPGNASPKLTLLLVNAGNANETMVTINPNKIPKIPNIKTAIFTIFSPDFG